MADTDMPGQIYAANITPDVETGIGSWTDGEKIRAIREGVDKNGRALFPIMPYSFYRYMSDEDVQSLVAFLDTIPPIKHQLPPTKVNFPDSMWMKGDPRPVTEPVQSARSKRTNCGTESIWPPFRIARFATRRHPGLKEDVSLRFAGGRHFITPVGDVYSANITPDKATGIGDWDVERFKNRLKIYLQYEAQGRAAGHWSGSLHHDAVSGVRPHDRLRHGGDLRLSDDQDSHPVIRWSRIRGCRSTRSHNRLFGIYP